MLTVNNAVLFFNNIFIINFTYWINVLFKSTFLWICCHIKRVNRAMLSMVDLRTLGCQTKQLQQIKCDRFKFYWIIKPKYENMKNKLYAIYSLTMLSIPLATIFKSYAFLVQWLTQLKWLQLKMYSCMKMYSYTIMCHLHVTHELIL